MQYIFSQCWDSNHASLVLYAISLSPHLVGRTDMILPKQELNAPELNCNDRQIGLSTMG